MSVITVRDVPDEVPDELAARGRRHRCSRRRDIDPGGPRGRPALTGVSATRPRSSRLLLVSGPDGRRATGALGGGPLSARPSCPSWPPTPSAGTGWPAWAAPTRRGRLIGGRAVSRVNGGRTGVGGAGVTRRAPV